MRLILLKKKKGHCDSAKNFYETDFIKMVEVFFNNIFALFGLRIFQQTVGIPLDANCIPLFVDLFLYSYEADVI